MNTAMVRFHSVYDIASIHSVLYVMQLVLIILSSLDYQKLVIIAAIVEYMHGDNIVLHSEVIFTVCTHIDKHFICQFHKVYC